MGGDVTFQQALSARLEIIKPSTQSIDKFNQSHKPLLTKGIKYVCCSSICNSD